MKTTIIALLLTASSIQAASAYLEFDDITLFGGTLSYGGADGVDPLVGKDLIFDVVNGVGTPITGPLQIIGGKLNFTTGPNISELPTLYEFAAGGSFTLTGTVIKPDLSVVASGVLLTGLFDGPSFVIGLGGGNGLFSGLGIDEKNRELLAYYGVSDLAFKFSNTEIGFATAGLAPNGGFRADVIDSDLTNTAVPEPGTVGAAIGLGGLVLWHIRRRKS